jgi:hypothetical protein
MKRFLAIYTGSPDGMAAWMKLPKEELLRRQGEGIAAWQTWVANQQAVLADGGGPLGRTKRITAQGITDIRNHMSAYTIVLAESHEEAARMFLGHPHFSIFPGDGVEVMECLPVPSM